MNIDTKTHQRILEMIAQGKGHRAIAQELGIGVGTVSRYRNTPLPSPENESEEQVEIKGDQWNITLPKTRIHTLDDLLKHFKVDTSVWEVERFICNKYEMGYKDKNDEGAVMPLYQVKAFLRRNRVVEFAKVQVAKLREEAERYSPVFAVLPPRPKEGSGNVVEYAISDHHFGALIWGKETGGEDYDLNIAKKCYEDALGSLVAGTRGYAPEKALIVFGNDQQNADNRSGTTEKGTAQSMDSRYQKMAGVSQEASKWAVDSLLAEFGAVDVIMVPGNHDPLATWNLGCYLSAWYRNCPRVRVDNSPLSRKYYEYGVNMLLFTHGNAGKLEDYDRTMAAERPDMWGRTKWREAHTGDKHHRRLIELKGAAVRILPSLRPPDSWTSENHYIGSLRAAEAYVWNKDRGLIGTAVHSVLK